MRPTNTTSPEYIKQLEAQLAEARAALKQAEESCDKLYKINEQIARQRNEAERKLSKIYTAQMIANDPAAIAEAVLRKTYNRIDANEDEADALLAEQESPRAALDADIAAGREYLQRHPMTELLSNKLEAGDIYNADKEADA